jgi:hypothetical protein
VIGCVARPNAPGLAGAALTALALTVAAPPAWPVDLRVDQLGPFTNESDGSGQRSSTPYTPDIRTDGVLRIAYRAPRAHCSAVRVRVSVDDRPAVVSAPVDPGQQSEVLDLGPQTPGVHALAVHAEGVPGGCNTGRLLSWGGTLLAWTSGPDAGPVVAEAAPLGDVVFEIERISYEYGFSYRGEYIPADGAVYLYGTHRRRPLVPPPASDDGYYGIDWLLAKYGRVRRIAGQAADDELAHQRALARTLGGHEDLLRERRPPRYDPASVTVTVYLRDPARGAYRRIVLAERGEQRWSSPPPAAWDEGSAAAAEMTAWLLRLTAPARTP